jgi:hypothetical protein
LKPNIRRMLLPAALMLALAALPPSASGQAPKAQPVPPAGAYAQQPPVAAAADFQPDAGRTREELHSLLERYAPALRHVLALDPSLLTNQAYLAPYPGLAAYLAAHPEIARNPSFYLGDGPQFRPESHDPVLDLWGNVLGGMAAFIGVGMAIGLITWLIRTFIDYRRWSRLSKVQAEVHTKLLDRFGSNEDLLAYIQSPAGGKFLELTPIKLDAGPRTLGAPMGRILWSIQGGVVLVAAGIGLWIISASVSGQAAQPLQAFGVLALALGIGFVVSAIISYGVARRLGLLDSTAETARNESAAA